MKNNRLNILQKKISENYNKEKKAITMITLGTSSLLIYTPIYYSNITLQEIIITVIEIGLITLPIVGLKKLKESKQQIKIIRKNMNYYIINNKQKEENPSPKQREINPIFIKKQSTNSKKK